MGSFSASGDDQHARAEQVRKQLLQMRVGGAVGECVDVYVYKLSTVHTFIIISTKVCSCVIF